MVGKGMGGLWGEVGVHKQRFKKFYRSRYKLLHNVQKVD